MGSSYLPQQPVTPQQGPVGDPGGSGDVSPALPPGVPDDPTVISKRLSTPGSAPGSTPPPAGLGNLVAGEQLGHFQLLEYAGGGGMGAVFRARDTMLNREVAVKVLSRDQAADEETRRRFQKEAQSAARLDHDNIARVYYVGEDHGVNYIVFEFIEGVNIRELVEQKGPLPLDEAISYTLQIADALDHASDRNVVHRDIKPSNVLITAQGRAKLVDMGLARLHQLHPGSEDLTASGVTLGTFDYISPEQARDPRSADVRSDIYSLGCTLYFMLTGRPPFPEGTVLQKLLQHNSAEPLDPRQINPDLPAEIADILNKMLAKNPRQRYQRPNELISELLVLSERVGIRSPLPRRILTSAPAGGFSYLERHLPWLVPVAALLSIVALLELAWWDTTPVQLPPLEPRAMSSVDPQSPAGGELPPGERESTETPMPKEPATGAGTTTNALQPASTSRNDTTPTAIINAPSTVDPTSQPPATTTPNSPRGTGSQGTSPPGSSPTLEQVSQLPLLARGGAGPPEASSTSVGTSGTGTSGSAGSNPNTVSTVPGPEPLVVIETADGPQGYASLRAACSAARDGDVIELRFDGRHVEKPFSLNNSNVTVRAGEGFRPRIVFRPTEVDPVKSPRAMMTVSGGRLTLVNVSVEFDVPAPNDLPAEHWSLFEMRNSAQAGLEKCWLTVRNAREDGTAYHENVAFFRIVSGAGNDMPMPGADSLATAPATIRLEHCVARGEAIFIEANDSQPLELYWDNGLLVATGPMLALNGGEVQQPGGQVLVILSHLTAVLHDKVYQLVGSVAAPFLLDVNINCADSIMLTNNNAPLVDQVVVGKSNLESQLTWNGDRNFYEGFNWDSFWRIEDLASPEALLQRSFLDWQDRWGQRGEIRPCWDRVLWERRPGHGRPPHTVTVPDYALAERTENNPARQGAHDGQDAGMEAPLLPALPDAAEEPLKESSPAADPPSQPPGN